MFTTMAYALVPLAVTAFSLPLSADEWTKNFHVGGAPELRVETSDANVTLRAGASPSIDVRVTTSGWRIGPGDVHVFDHQAGDRVEIEVKVPPLHFNLGNRWVKIEVTLPSGTKTNVHTGDGNIRADGLRAASHLVTHDGNIDGEGFEGALDASSGDGNIRVRGKFSGLAVESGDGNVEIAVERGSRMTSGWSVHTGDGNATLRLPEGFAADLDAHTGDGHITVDLPLTTTGGKQEDSLVGKLNGGGATLTVRTGDGSVHLERL